MASSNVGPRSVKDATRFTSTTPHATSKSSTAEPAAAASSSGPTAGRVQPSASSSAAAQQAPKMSRMPGETPEQRVHRLRQAHLAAQRAQISRTDRVVNASRRVLDVVHSWTTASIVLFTVGAGLVSVYSVWDMLRYNRARRTEWLEAQKRLEADALAIARIAYLKGEATAAQAELVEEANREAQAKGTKLPPLLAPQEHRTHFEEKVQPVFVGGDKSQGKGVLGMLSGLFGGGQQAVESSARAEARADGSEMVATTGVLQKIESRAKSAWEREKENQRRGGSLDQLGLEMADPSQDKKGWRPW